MYGEPDGPAPRISGLEAARLPAAQHQDGHPVEPLVDVLKRVNSAPPGFVARPARREHAERPQRRRRRFPQLVISPGRSSPVIRKARNHRTRKGVRRA
ncbi:hypothetical protein ACH4UR_37490 [Streptomyces lydicus]|uniref:hypothetical protein n=1 Tax=Streptomyces lydicus TaxID=47763 RepID=UPI0033D172A9